MIEGLVFGVIVLLALGYAFASLGIWAALLGQNGHIHLLPTILERWFLGTSSSRR
jgi:hypothetical protein